MLAPQTQRSSSWAGRRRNTRSRRPRRAAAQSRSRRRRSPCCESRGRGRCSNASSWAMPRRTQTSSRARTARSSTRMLAARKDRQALAHPLPRPPAHPRDPRARGRRSPQSRLRAPRSREHHDHARHYSHTIPAMQETAASLVASLVFDQKWGRKGGQDGQHRQRSSVTTGNLDRSLPVADGWGVRQDARSTLYGADSR
jgi:hypothetical protein